MSHPLLPKNKNKDTALFRQGKPDFIQLSTAAFPVPTAEEAGTILEHSDTGDRFRWTSTAWVIIGLGGAEVIDTGLPTTAFGDLKTESKTPITQISGEYGLLEQVLTVADSAASGTNTVVDNKFTCQTGTSATGLASITSLRQLSYKPGQGAIAEITALFTTGVALNQQVAGLISAENILGFGFNGIAFGIIHAHGGENESQELTITTPAAGAESATINIDGNPLSVPLTAGTVQHNAVEIAASLNTQVVNYLFTSNDDQVVAQARISGPQGAFTFSSATAVAAWAQIVGGVEPTIDFISQVDWNVDTRLSEPVDYSERKLDPTKGNPYQIQYQYLGFGGIKFFVEDSRTGKYVLVHVIEYANKNTSTSVTNPSFRVGWLTRNIGNTTNITISGGSSGAFIEGMLRRSTPPRADDNNQLAVGTTLTNIITFRNRVHFGGKVNRIEIIPLLATLSSQTNKSAFFEVRANPTFGGDLDFSYIDKANSVMEVATDAVTVSGGRLLAAATVVAGSSIPLEFNTRVEQIFAALPSQIFSIACRMSSGAAADAQATGTWTENI